MATPIKQVPILTGEAAEAFIREAEANEKLPRQRLSEKDQEMVRRVMRRMEEFVPSWRRKQ